MATDVELKIRSRKTRSTCGSGVRQVHSGPTHGHLLPAAARAAHTSDGNLSRRGDSLVLLLLGVLERRRRRGAQLGSLQDRDTHKHTSLTHPVLLAI